MHCDGIFYQGTECDGPFTSGVTLHIKPCAHVGGQMIVGVGC